MSVTLEQAKAHLRVTNNHEDGRIASLVMQSKAILVRLTGSGYDDDAEDLDVAQLLVIEWLFRPDDKMTLDAIYKLPLAVVALAVPFRTPSIA